MASLENIWKPNLFRKTVCRQGNSNKISQNIHLKVNILCEYDGMWVQVNGHGAVWMPVYSSQIISVARCVNTQQTCIIVYLVNETWLSNIWKTTDDDSSSVWVNWRKAGKVLTHFLQVLQVLALTFHYSGHPREIHMNGTWMGSVLTKNRRNKCQFQFQMIHLKTTWSKKYYVINMSVIKLHQLWCFSSSG